MLQLIVRSARCSECRYRAGPRINDSMGCWQTVVVMAVHVKQTIPIVAIQMYGTRKFALDPSVASKLG